jgi:predicted dehydrogenase
MAAEPGPRRRVLGDAGAFVAPELDGQEDALKRGEAPQPGGWLTFYAGWERALRGEGPVPVDPADAVAGLEVLDAARRSAASGEVVSLG